MRTYHPALADASDAEIRALSPGAARLVLAREHGFASWAAFRRHVDDLAESGEPFRRAFRAIQARDGKALGELLDRYPGLVSARGTNGNDLLGLAANAVCGRRDQAMVRELLARGADPNGANDRGWTAAAPGGLRQRHRARPPAAGRRRAHRPRGTRRGRNAARRRALLGTRETSPTSWRSGASRPATCASRPASAAWI